MEAHKLIMSVTINEVRVIMAIVFLVLFFILGKYLNKENSYLWLKIASISAVLLIFPLHYAMLNWGLYGYCISMAVLTILNVIYLLPIAGILADLFAKKFRYTGVSLSINVVSSLFGGTAPLILTFLVSYFDSFFAGGIYLFITATIGYLTASQLTRESKKGMVYVG
jgi:MHS family proline/betaine transporter-like MFS transporter